eukprot:RCo051396
MLQRVLQGPPLVPDAVCQHYGGGAALARHAVHKHCAVLRSNCGIDPCRPLFEVLQNALLRGVGDADVQVLQVGQPNRKYGLSTGHHVSHTKGVQHGLIDGRTNASDVQLVQHFGGVTVVVELTQDCGGPKDAPTPRLWARRNRDLQLRKLLPNFFRAVKLHVLLRSFLLQPVGQDIVRQVLRTPSTLGMAEELHTEVSIVVRLKIVHLHFLGFFFSARGGAPQQTAPPYPAWLRNHSPGTGSTEGRPAAEPPMPKQQLPYSPPFCLGGTVVGEAAPGQGMSSEVTGRETFPLPVSNEDVRAAPRPTRVEVNGQEKEGPYSDLFPLFGTSQLRKKTAGCEGTKQKQRQKREKM